MGSGIEDILNGELQREEYGLINDYSTRLFGSPFQLLDSVDRRFPEINKNLGNEYLKNIMLNSPILRIRPGMPKYTGNINYSSLSQIAKRVYTNLASDKETSKIVGLKTSEAWLREIGTTFAFGSGAKLQGRMFGFRETYYEYIQNVNYMCRSVATYMNLISSDSDYPIGCYTHGDKWHTFDKMDWQDYRMGSAANNDSRPTEQIKGYLGVFVNNINEFIANFITTILPSGLTEGADAYLQQSPSSSILNQISSKLTTVEFMVQPIEFTETLRNQTKNSTIEGMIDGITQGVGTEIAWITNSNADVGIVDNLVDFLGNGLQSVGEVLSGLVQPVTGGFTTNLFSGAMAAIKGQKMIYPKIYDSSESTMDYQFSITLTTPYGDPYNYYMNIIVPLLHLIALVSPRMVSANTVSSPFLVQAFIPGMCTCQMGIIRNMTITKNPTTKHVSVNGFPLTVKVTFEIEELYNAMAISPANDPASFLHNETLNDYLANIAGLAPSLETYSIQRQAMYQGVNRYFDKALFAQDWASGLVEKLEDFVRPGTSY